MADPSDAQYAAQVLALLGASPSGTLAGQINGLGAILTPYTGYRKALALADLGLVALMAGLEARLDGCAPADVPTVRLQYDIYAGMSLRLAAAIKAVEASGATASAVYTFNLDFLEPAAEAL